MQYGCECNAFLLFLLGFFMSFFSSGLWSLSFTTNAFAFAESSQKCVAEIRFFNLRSFTVQPDHGSRHNQKDFYALLGESKGKKRKPTNFHSTRDFYLFVFIFNGKSWFQKWKWMDVIHVYVRVRRQTLGFTM